MLANNLTVGGWLNARALRWAFLVGVALDLTLVGGRALLYPAAVTLPGGWIYLLEPLVLLLVYAGLGWLMTRSSSPARQAALRDGALFGLVSGAVWVVSLALETFADLSAQVAAPLSLVLFLCAFLPWGMAGLRTARRGGSMLLAILAAVWSAMNSIVILVTFGFLLMYTSLPRLEQDIATAPEFLSSGWHDVGAYAIANTFDAGFSHLLIAPLVAVVFGALGALLGSTIRRLKSAPGAAP